MTYREKMQLEQPEAVSDRFAGGVLACPGSHFPGAPHIDNCGKSENCYKSCTDCWNTKMPAQTIKDGGEAPKTHGDCIRAMTDEELAEWLVGKTFYRESAWSEPSYLNFLTGRSEEYKAAVSGTKEWLQQPAEVEDGTQAD